MFREGFKCLKVSEREAMLFTRKKYREYARKCYPLGEGEDYEGYVIFNHGRGFVEVGWIKGALVKITEKDLTCPITPKMKEHLTKGWSYKVVKADGTLGECQRVQTFGGCSFASEVEHLQNRGIIQPYVEPLEMEEQLQNKLVNAAINWQKDELKISQDEELVLTGYFGFKFWQFVC